MFKSNGINPKNTIQTIDINAYEWFDKVNGNSYFASVIVLNYGLKTEKTVKLPFQYGYGDSYKYEALKELEIAGLIHGVKKYSHGGSEDIYNFCQRNKIVIRTSKQQNCKKSDLKNI